MKANKKGEKIIIDAVDNGKFKIDSQGRIFVKRNNEIIRAENKTTLGYLQIRKIVRGESRQKQPGKTGDYSHRRQYGIKEIFKLVNLSKSGIRAMSLMASNGYKCRR